MIVRCLIALLGLAFLPVLLYAQWSTENTRAQESTSRSMQSIVWQPEQQITFDTNYNYIPRIFASQDTLHLFWKRGDLMYTRSTNLGITWSPPINLYVGRPGNNGTSNSIAMSGRFLYLVWISCDTCRGNPLNYWVTLRRSTNSGQSFEPYRLLFPGLPWSITASDSFVVFQPRNDLGDDSLQVSSDFGYTWLSKPLAERNSQEMFLKNGILHLFQPAIGTPDYEVSHSYSTNYGTNWSAEQLLSTNDGMISYRYNAAGNSDSIVCVVWMDGKYGSASGFSTSVLLRRSLNGGRTWEPEQLLTSLPSALHPRISQRGSFIGVVWENEGQPFRGISFRLSTDSGENWEPEFYLSDSSVPAGGPGILIDNNSIHVVWSDNRTGRPQVFYRRGTLVPTTVMSGSELPDELILHHNYPNPFNSTTIISYVLPKRANISLLIVDLLGREIMALYKGVQEAGTFLVRFEGMNLSSGTYFAVLKSNGKVAVRPLTLIK